MEEDNEKLLSVYCFKITSAQFSRTSLNQRITIYRANFQKPEYRGKIDDESDPALRFSVSETQTEV